MAVDLVFYTIDETNGMKVKLNNALDFGNIFKGSQKKIPITIYNAGDSPAISPKMTIKQYPIGNFADCYKWKRISFDRDKNFSTSLILPEIKSKGWLTGKTIQFEDFNNYPTIAGTKPDQSWLLWEGSRTSFEVYNGWLQHNIDTIDGRALWTELSTAKNFEFSMKVTIRDGVYGGIIVRDEGDSNTGYIVVVNGMKSHLGNVPTNEGVIQVFTGKFTSGIGGWKQIYKSPSIGIRGTHDFFKVRLIENKFEFWYKDDTINPKFSFIDEDNTYEKASKPIICCHAGFGSVLTYFDDIKMEVENNDGVIWIENTVDEKTPVFGSQYSVLNVEYGGVE